MKREFDELCHRPVRRVAVGAALVGEIPELVRMAAVEIPSLAASEAAVLRVQEQNPESIWAFRRGTRLVGAYAMLLLNSWGCARLLAGELDCATPPLECLSAPGEVVAAIYKWAVVAPGLATEGVNAMSRYLQGPLYATANLYARSTASPARRLIINVGFQPTRQGSNLLVYVRMRNRAHVSPLAA
jgi:hypothetical protein